MAERNTQLLAQLLEDPSFRDRFRRDPAATARAAGLDELADALAESDANPMETLEPRESRSSLSGVLLAAAVEGIALFEGAQHLLPPIDAAEAATTQHADAEGWVFVRSGESFPGNHPDYGQLRGFGGSGVLWDPDDPGTAAGIASTHQAGLKAGIWLVPRASESPEAYAQRAAAAIERHHPDRVVFDIEAIGKGYKGSAGWDWSDAMMKAFSRLTPNPPPLAVTVEPNQDDFNYAAYTSLGAEVWPQSYLGDMTPQDPGVVVDRVVANGVPRDLVVPVLGPKQLDGYGGPHNIYTADDIQGRTPPPAPPPQPQVADPVTPAPSGADVPIAHPGAEAPPDDASRSPPPQGIVEQAAAAQQQLPMNPDDLEGDQDDEDAGEDEEDGSDENEPDEDEGGDDEGTEDEDGSDDDSDAPGEGSNGEDADDDSSDGDSSDGDSSNGDSSDDSDDADSSDASDGSDSTDAAPDLSAVDSAYPGDDAPREQIAAWMGSEAEKRGIPPELPVMAGLTESGLRNLSYGDADSIGFFQMRASVWDQGTYKGYGDNPRLQLKWFVDRALEVKQQRLGRGQSVTDPNQYGDWVADVENPAAQYRGRYQTHLAEARDLLSQANPKGHPSAEAADAADAAGSITGGPRALKALALARSELGTPYRWGGSSPSTGFDCSGLVQWAYAKVGIQIPRVTDQQILAANGTVVDRKHLLAGDLVFFRDSTGYVHHVGISLGGDRFLHAPHTGDVVKISSLNESYYAQQFTGGRRFDHAAEAVARSSSSRDQGDDTAAARLAQQALERDSAEVQRQGSALALALQHQEQRNEELNNAVQFLRAVDPSLVKRPSA